jgi:hypothetical protein
MTCKEYKDRALLKYVYYHTENAVIAMSLSTKRTSSKRARRPWLESAMLLSANYLRIWLVQRSIPVDILASDIEEKANVCLASTKNAQ